MGSIRLIQKPENGKLIITVPDEMRDETIVIDFRPARESESVVQAQEPTLPQPSRSDIIARMKGKSKNSVYPVNKYDVYNQ